MEHLLRIRLVLGSHTLTHVFPTTTLTEGCYYHPHFTEVETEAKKVYVICLRSHSQI